jgi:hypothetical protein
MTVRRGAAAAVAAMLVIAARVAAAAPEMNPQPVAVLQGLDKITARVSRFAAPVGQTVTLGDLSIVVRECDRSAPEERPENAAFIQIYENRPGEAQLRVFSGWMFSSSPALSALEHPVYDVNLLQCKAADGSPAPATAARSTGKSAGKTAR